MPHAHHGAVAVLVLCAFATGAEAQNNSPSTTVIVNPLPQAPSPPPQTTLNDPFALTEILGAEALEAESVQAAFSQSNQALTATNEGNSVTGETIQTGDISIESDSFSSFSGIGNFVMNTGNNSNLQGSVSVVVVVTPPAP